MGVTVRLWVLSDLHLDLTRGWELPQLSARPAFDVMVIAGDLITRMERGVIWLLKHVPDHQVIYVPGNHEFYGTDIDRTVEKARQIASGTNVEVLQNDFMTIDDTLFVGATRAMAPTCRARPVGKIPYSKSTTL